MGLIIVFIALSHKLAVLRTSSLGSTYCLALTRSAL